MNQATRLRVLGLTIAMGLATGCARSDPEGSDRSSSSKAAPTPTTAAAPDANDPCRLLQPAEVEAVLGAALAGPPYRAAPPNNTDAGVPSPDGKACWYVTEDFRNILVEWTPTGGGDIFQMLGTIQGAVDTKLKGALKLQDGSTLTGEWDEARILNRVKFMALRGDSLVEIDFGGSAATEAQVATLADAALLRMEKPLPIDGNAGAAASMAHERRRPPVKTACDLLQKQDVEEILGQVSAQEAPGAGEVCNYTYLDASGKKKYLSLIVDEWREGFREFRDTHGAMQSAVAVGTSGDDMDSGEKKSAASLLSATLLAPGPWDAASSSFRGVQAVKHDVLMTLDPPSKTDPELVRRLMTRIYQRAGLLAKPAS